MLNDEIVKICKVDKMILLFGCRVFDRSRLKLDKIGEKKQIVQMEMRKLSSLLQLFNVKEILCIKYNIGLDMLLYKNFDVLKMFVEARTFTDDLMVKTGLKGCVRYISASLLFMSKSEHS